MATETESTWTSKIFSKIEEQAWFASLRSKWDELDAQSQLYSKGAAIVIGSGLLIFASVSLAVQTYTLRSEIQAKQKLLSLLQAGTDEIKALQDSLPASRSTLDSPPATLQALMDTIAQVAAVDRGALAVGAESSGADSGQFRETIAEVTVKHVGIRQLVRVIHALENGPRVAKVRHLTVDTKLDPEGYLDAVLSTSFYGPKEPKK